MEQVCSNCVIITYSVISLPMVVSFPSYLIFVVMHLPGFQHPARLALLFFVPTYTACMFVKVQSVSSVVSVSYV